MNKTKTHLQVHRTPDAFTAIHAYVGQIISRIATMAVQFRHPADIRLRKRQSAPKAARRQPLVRPQERDPRESMIGLSAGPELAASRHEAENASAEGRTTPLRTVLNDLEAEQTQASACRVSAHLPAAEIVAARPAAESLPAEYRPRGLTGLWTLTVNTRMRPEASLGSELSQRPGSLSDDRLTGSSLWQ